MVSVHAGLDVHRGRPMESNMDAKIFTMDLVRGILVDQSINQKESINEIYWIFMYCPSELLRQSRKMWSIHFIYI